MNTEKIKSGFQLLATSVQKIELSNNFVVLNDDTNIERSFDVSYNINDVSSDEDKEVTMGTITLNIDISIKSNENEMKLNIDLQGCFIDDDASDFDKFREMLGVNGCASLYSIARAMILSITSQVCHGAHILIPMINVFKLVEGNIS